MRRGTVNEALTTEETRAVIRWLKESPRSTMPGGWESWLGRIRSSPGKHSQKALEAAIADQCRAQLSQCFGVARALVDAVRHRVETEFIARLLLFEASCRRSQHAEAGGAPKPA